MTSGVHRRAGIQEAEDRRVCTVSFDHGRRVWVGRVPRRMRSGGQFLPTLTHALSQSGSFRSDVALSAVHTLQRLWGSDVVCEQGVSEWENN